MNQTDMRWIKPEREEGLAVKKMKRLISCFLAMIMMLQIPMISLAEENSSVGEDWAEELQNEETEDPDAEDEDADDPDDDDEDEEDEEDEEEAGAAGKEEKVYPEELIVGHTTITKGDFFTELFGNDTADIDVRALIHGYNLVNWDQNQGVYVFDPSVVVNVRKTVDADGDHIYHLILAEDLEYSDGTPITAWDYAFSLLLMMSPEIEQIGGKIYRAEHILGYDGYIAGRLKAMRGEEVPFKEKSLGGVDVIDDHQLMITLDHEFLPYYFEVGLLLCVPYPISVIAPGCKVYDDGFGIYIGNEDPSVTEPVYTAELLRKTILDPETGYNSHPSVVSGPYVLKDWDGVTAHFEINEHFKGAWFHNSLPGVNPINYGSDKVIPLLDEDGQPRKDASGNDSYLVRPTIKKIAFTEADNETMIAKLSSGELHLINKAVYGPTIQEGMSSFAENNFTPQNYPRIGLAFATFTYDWPTVHEEEVRQAIAWCMDRDALTEKYCTGYGVVVDGYFGIEQWEYLLINHQIDYPIMMLDENYRAGANPEYDEMVKGSSNRFVRTDAEYEAAEAAWEALSLDQLTKYTVNLDRARQLLDKAGWTLNREGGAYQEGTDDVRCKEIDGNLVALDLTMMYPEGNHMAEYMSEEGMFIDNLAKVGIRLTLVPTPMQDLLYSYYRQTERTTDMIYLATNFHVIVDPSITYSTDTTKDHQIWNNTYSDDEELFERAVDMRKTEPYDMFTYVTKWIRFQERYNEVLPTIPIYSNIYFDFVSNDLQNYYITSQVTWSQAILLSYFGLPFEEEEAEGDEELSEFDDF